MREWSRHFFGTPRRATATFIAFALIIVIIFPGLLQSAVERLIAALMPLLGPALVVVIVFAGLRMIVFGRHR